MKIAVCVKQVPDSWAEKKMVNGLLDRENVDAVLNDLDEYAVEEALRIAEAHGGNEEGGCISLPDKCYTVNDFVKQISFMKKSKIEGIFVFDVCVSICSLLQRGLTCF